MSGKSRFNWQAMTALSSLIVALAAIITSAFGAWNTSVSIQRTLKSDQQHIAEQAAISPNPACKPPTPAHAGSCAPLQALSVAKALAPAANQQPVTTATKAGALAFLTPDAYAAGPVDRGEDVSSYQGCSINWRLRGYVSWIVAKDDEGASYHDPCARHNVASARAAGKYVSTYFFARNNVSPTASADRQYRDDRAAGFNPTATGSLPGTLDYETNDAGLSPAAQCAWINGYIGRYMADSHRHQLLLYSSAGTWANCLFLPSGTLLWDAAYGPSWNVLRPFQVAYAWQYSDGVFGPPPHLDGGDSDVWLGSHAQLVALARPPQRAKPIAAGFTRDCSQLDAVTWWKRRRGSVSSQQHRQAVADRAALRRAGIGCTAQPHSKPYRLPPRRKSALA